MLEMLSGPVALDGFTVSMTLDVSFGVNGGIAVVMILSDRLRFIIFLLRR